MATPDIFDCSFECEGCHGTFAYDDRDKKGGICYTCMHCCDCGCECDHECWNDNDSDGEESEGESEGEEKSEDKEQATMWEETAKHNYTLYTKAMDKCKDLQKQLDEVKEKED